MNGTTPYLGNSSYPPGIIYHMNVIYQNGKTISGELLGGLKPPSPPDSAVSDCIFKFSLHEKVPVSMMEFTKKIKSCNCGLFKKIRGEWSGYYRGVKVSFQSNALTVLTFADTFE